MCGFCSGAEGICVSTQNSEQCFSNQWEGSVYIEFSSVNLRTIKDCGIEKSESDKDGNTVTIEKTVNVMEWDYSKSKIAYTKKNLPAYYKEIFIDCSDAAGFDLYNACSEETKELESSDKEDVESIDIYALNKKRNLQESGLIKELVFAIRQFKDLLYQLEKDGHSQGGEVTLYITAAHPVECLLFAFAKVLGLSVEKEKLYSSFSSKAMSDPFLKKTQKWMNDRHWKVKLEYCKVTQIYIQQVKVLTDKGKRAKRKKEVETLKQALSDINRKAEIAWQKYIRNHNSEDKKEYDRLLKEWTDAGEGRGKRCGSGVFHKDYGELGYVGMEYPTLEYDWAYKYDQESKTYGWVFQKGMHTYDWYVALLGLIERVEKQPITSDDLEKQKQKILKEAEKLDAALKKDEKEFREGRKKVIDDKLKELEERKTQGTDKADFWNERYDQDYGSASTKQRDKDMGLIEFEGELLDEYQLKGKINEVKREFDTRRVEIALLLDSAAKLQEVIDDIFYDKLLTGAQLVIAGVSIIFAPVLTPMLVGVSIGLDIALEVGKWVFVDDTWDENLKVHLLTIGLDVLFIGFGPLLRKVLGWTALRSLKSEINVTDQAIKNATELEQKAKALEKAAGEIDVKTAKTLSEEARKGADAAATDAKAAKAELDTAKAELDEAMTKFLSDDGQAVLAVQQYNTAFEKYVDLYHMAVTQEQGAKTLEETYNLRKAQKAQADLKAKIARTKANKAKGSPRNNNTRLEELKTEAANWLDNYNKPPKTSNKPTTANKPLETANKPSTAGSYQELVSTALGIDREALVSFNTTINNMKIDVPKRLLWYRRGVLVTLPIFAAAATSQKYYYLYDSYVYWNDDLFNYQIKDLDPNLLQTTE